MRNTVILLLVAAVCAQVALGQPAITSFSGGSQYIIYYGGSTGDVIGWRFTVDQQTWVTDVGVWNNDQTGGLETDHPVGIWDDTQMLMDSAIVGPTGSVVGDWIYEPIGPVVLVPGTTYTTGVLYFSDDDDYYISSATSMVTDPNINWTNSVYPAAGSMGFVYPTLSSTSFGRFGPNFIFNLTALERTTWGSIKTAF
jgi:hypothetical protein